MTNLDLTAGLTDNDQYKAFKFPAGEIHFILKNPESIQNHAFMVSTRLNTSDDIMLLILAVDTLKKTFDDAVISVYIPYMPYMQADRDFSVGECFSLKTIATILNSLPINRFVVFDPHSDVTPALLRNCTVVDNHGYIHQVINQITDDQKKLVLLSPDAGAYKKIFKLASGIHFQGEVASANKSRSISSGNIDSVEISKQDFEGKDVLIVDDICIGGRTFIELAKKLKERNVGNLHLAVSHGIFSNGFTELHKYFSKVYTTNSRKDSYSMNPAMTTLGDLVPDNFIYIHKII